MTIVPDSPGRSVPIVHTLFVPASEAGEAEMNVTPFG